jgi:hypothetical protein
VGSPIAHLSFTGPSTLEDSNSSVEEGMIAESTREVKTRRQE